jgi:hypothetical protein
VSFLPTRVTPRVYVLDGPVKIGEDGPFLYTSTAASATTAIWLLTRDTTLNDIVATTHPSLRSHPMAARSPLTHKHHHHAQQRHKRLYQIGDGEKVTINGSSATFTIGSDKNYGDSKTVTWSATGDNNGTTETNSGSETYTKVIPTLCTRSMSRLLPHLIYMYV